MKPRIKVLTLGVDDLERSLRFYREGLGLETEGIIGTEFVHGSVVFFDLEGGLRPIAEPHVRSLRVIAAGAVVYTRHRTTILGLGHEIEPGGQNLLHQQTGGDGFQRVVHSFGYGLARCIRLGDQIGEPGVELVWCIACCASDDLDDLSQAGAVTDRQGMFTPNPVEAFLGHPQGNDDINVIPDILLCGVF